MKAKANDCNQEYEYANTQQKASII